MTPKKGTLIFASLAVAMFGSFGCPDPEGFVNADAVRGGSLYDKWWAVAGDTEPTEDHPLWAARPDMDSNTRSGSTTWRCKECHAWDYKGVDGAYGSGSHRTGFPGIFGLAGVDLRTKHMDAQNVFDNLQDDHSFGAMTNLTEGDLWDLVKFVLEGQLDTDGIIDAQGAFIGDTTAGEALYTANCTVCHGVDGLAQPPGSTGFDDFPGLIANENPWEFQHKVSFGQPGTAMPALADGITVEEIGDLGAFVQTLPTTSAN